MTHGGDEHSLKISALNLLWFCIDTILKILNERIIELMNDKGAYRGAQATLGLLNICKFYIRKGLLETKVLYKSPRKTIKKEQNGYEPWRIQKKIYCQDSLQTFKTFEDSQDNCASKVLHGARKMSYGARDMSHGVKKVVS